jgi:putative Mg2+ transporter-C (MgtC) family protein
MDERSAEATYEVHVLTQAEHVGEVRDLLAEQLEGANYPVREIEVSERSEDVTELAATLISTAVHPEEMEAVVAALEASPLISHASWLSSATE